MLASLLLLAAAAASPDLAADAGSPDLAAATAPSDLAAVGVVLAPSPERSVAILRADGRTRVAAVNDEVFGGRLVAVAADSVTLEFGADRVTVRVSAAPGAAIAAAAPPPPRPPSREEPGGRVLEREAVQRRLDLEIPRILAETAIRPVTEDGRVIGVRLTRMAANSILTEVGLQAGDVLTSINGTEIDGMGALIGLWPRLQGATDLRADVLRDGRPFKISLSLK